MPEVQKHGFVFQQWVMDTFFPANKEDANGAESYTAKWDVPKECNNSSKIPAEFRHIPVSIKSVKYGTPVYFGDALRQYDISENFLLIVGFWKQQDPEHKRFVAIEYCRISAVLWRSLWNPLCRNSIAELDRLIKSSCDHYSILRKKAQKYKKTLPACSMVLNPKIDSKTQRRLQCSIRFKLFWGLVLEKEPALNPSPALWGCAFSNPIFSPVRQFNK